MSSYGEALIATIQITVTSNELADIQTCTLPIKVDFRNSGPIHSTVVASHTAPCSLASYKEGVHVSRGY